MGGFCSLLLLGTEIGFFTNNLRNFVKYNHFRKRIMVAGKCIISGCLLIFFTICLIISPRNVNSIEPVPSFYQSTGILMIASAILL
jgi:hypothetical protein